ncbi:MAG: glycosyltransferase [Candidatus Competibacteraceae bacterium]|nr:glycosyltransferase [Candidatus Competibacteraceae bacterium]
MRVYILSTAVAPLSSGFGGGVEHMVIAAARALHALGYAVQVIAPTGSKAEVPDLRILPGLLAPTALTLDYDDPLPIEAAAFLNAAVRELAQQARPGDVVLNFSYDWLPLFVSDFFPCPLATLVSMGSLNRSLDQEIRRVAERDPKRLAFLSAAQALSFGLSGAMRLIPPGVEMARYPYNARPERAICWLGRIVPEKGLDDVFAVASRTGQAVTVFGVLQDRVYWEDLVRRHPGVPVCYGGFLKMPALAEMVGQFRVLLMTPKCFEAFGVVGIEALACGTPVVAYRRGGISDYVIDGETGWLIAPDDLDSLCTAVGEVERIDRAHCRRLVENRYTRNRYGAALAEWIETLAAGSAHSTVVTR